MTAITLDPSKRVDIKYHSGTDGSKTFTFTDTAGDAYDISGFTFTMNIRRKIYGTTNTIQLTEGSGLTKSTSSLVFTLTDAQTAALAGDYYWELKRTDGSSLVKRWLNGYLQETKVFDGINESSSIVIDESGSAVTIAISESLPQATQYLLDETFIGGSLTSGQIGKHNWAIKGTGAGDIITSYKVNGGIVLLFSGSTAVYILNNFEYSKFISLEVKLAITDGSSANNLFFGMGPLESASSDNLSGYSVGFGCLVNSSSSYVRMFTNELNESAVYYTSSINKTDSNAHTYKFLKSGSNMLMYVDGTLVNTQAFTMTDDAQQRITPKITITSGTCDMLLDHIKLNMDI